MADVQLVIDGRIYGGWRGASVTRAMDAASGAFNLLVTDRWSGQDQPWPIEPGDEAEIRVDGETLMRGYVDIVRSSFSSRDHTIQVQGRDKSADMIDCSAVHKPDQWRKISLLKLAEILGAPFGIGVKAETDLGAPLDLVKLQHGETALEALNRHAKMRRVLVMPDGRGGILLTRTGARRAGVALVQGDNILRASGTLDWSERFSEYIVKGQAGFREETDGKTEAHAVATVKDRYVDRYRPLILVNDSETNKSTARDRAAWEANTRLGKSAEAQITLQGWRQSPGGPLWEPNMLVTVSAPWLQLEGEMLIRQVVYEKDDDGTTVQLSVVSPQAFEPEPPDGKQPKKPRRGGKSKGGGNSWLSADWGGDG